MQQLENLVKIRCGSKEVGVDLADIFESSVFMAASGQLQSSPIGHRLVMESHLIDHCP
jgi:hypothetical protein